MQILKVGFSQNRFRIIWPRNGHADSEGGNFPKFWIPSEQVDHEFHSPHKSLDSTILGCLVVSIMLTTTASICSSEFSVSSPWPLFSFSSSKKIRKKILGVWFIRYLLHKFYKTLLNLTTNLLQVILTNATSEQLKWIHKKCAYYCQNSLRAIF